MNKKKDVKTHLTIIPAFRGDRTLRTVLSTFRDEVLYDFIKQVEDSEGILAEAPITFISEYGVTLTNKSYNGEPLKYLTRKELLNALMNIRKKHDNKAITAYVRGCHLSVVFYLLWK